VEPGEMAMIIALDCKIADLAGIVCRQIETYQEELHPLSFILISDLLEIGYLFIARNAECRPEADDQGMVAFSDIPVKVGRLYPFHNRLLGSGRRRDAVGRQQGRSQQDAYNRQNTDAEDAEGEDLFHAGFFRMV